jgi:hypothetical protein
MADSTEPNGRVTTAQLLQAVIQTNDRMDDKFKQSNERMDARFEALARQIQEMTRVEPPRLVQQVKTIERDLEKEINQRQLEDECLQTGVDRNRDDIVELKIQSTRWDRINASLSVVTGVIAGLFGASR